SPTEQGFRGLRGRSRATRNHEAHEPTTGHRFHRLAWVLAQADDSAVVARDKFQSTDCCAPGNASQKNALKGAAEPRLTAPRAPVETGISGITGKNNWYPRNPRNPCFVGR